MGPLNGDNYAVKTDNQDKCVWVVFSGSPDSHPGSCVSYCACMEVEPGSERGFVGGAKGCNEEP